MAAKGPPKPDADQSEGEGASGGPSRPAEGVLPAPGRRPSSTDVARLAGVSQSAVSRSFTPGASVSAATKSKVLEAARTLGYQPNALPRMLLTQRSNLVALVIGDMANPFYAEVLRLTIAALDARGRRAVVFALGARGGCEKIDTAISEAVRHRVDGVIVTSANVGEATVEACQRMRVPVVLFNRFLNAPGVASIGCDNLRGGRAAAAELLAGGHGRFGFASGEPTAPSNLQRLRGYAARLKLAGHDVRVSGDANAYENGRDAARTLWAEGCDAIFCGSDVVAFGALDALRGELGLRVPQDIAVVGFDDVPMAGYGAYALTTIRQRRGHMVERAVDVLASLMEGWGEHVNERIPGLLVRRSTTRPSGTGQVDDPG